MKIILQRVTRAAVTVDEDTISAIGPGLLLLLGIHTNDTTAEADYLVEKCVGLRIFPDAAGKMNRSVRDSAGSVLVVSQFTLLGDCRHGRRPSFIAAAPPHKGEELYEYFIAAMRKQLKTVETGRFGAMMQVELVNDGPVTLILER